MLHFSEIGVPGGAGAGLGAGGLGGTGGAGVVPGAGLGGGQYSAAAKAAKYGTVNKNTSTKKAIKKNPKVYNLR